MSDSSQDVYAKHLQHADYGYPLRMPEPMSTLPDHYRDSGLQIGDVGVVDREGQFDVLFNIFKQNDNVLHGPRGVPKNFMPIRPCASKSNDNAIPPHAFHSRGIKRILKSNEQKYPSCSSSVDYEFDSSAPDGAILILPHGAESHQLLSPEQFREVATKNALDWYEFAKKCYGVQYFDRSLYLITGFYKARSWSLGSFNNPTNTTGKILARRDDNNLNVYLLEFTFPADHRHSRRDDDSGKTNQTVFITGFKITVSSWLSDPVVLRVTESETTWWLQAACTDKLGVEHSPSLSQPFHPSDIINRFLLSKNPNAKVAITHDSQWMDMMKLLYFCKAKCIRARNILSGLKRIPVGFYVSVQFDGDQRRTQNKSMRLNDSGIEWDDEIPLLTSFRPSTAFDKVEFTVYASFELEPMLGNGEALYSSVSRVEELVGGTYLITFSSGESRTAAPGPSLLITLAQRCSGDLTAAPSGDDSNLDSLESVLIRETNLGREALLRYYNEYQLEDLENAVQHFECAWSKCPLTHRCRAVVLVNFAKANFVRYQTEPTNANLNEVIDLYRQALGQRRPGHPDRPATLLQLAQILLFRYEKEGCDELIADEINKLMTESRSFSENSHERRAADLVLQTLKRCRVINSGSLAELNELVQELKRSAMVLPDGYFDRPQRLINLSTTLWRRYEKHGDFSDLDSSLRINEQALQLLPSRDPERLPGLRTHGAALWKLFEICGDIGYLRELISLDKEALLLVPKGHPEHRYWVTNSESHLAEMLECLADIAFEAQKHDEEIAQHT
ncbi:hypothetical protein F5141DRAFT_1204630 [Pisolithus sp. B1]|nr:hypothetical protein F5141DRAFT_1204630 [Pisolithus sp. B1]